MKHLKELKCQLNLVKTVEVYLLKACEVLIQALHGIESKL